LEVCFSSLEICFNDLEIVFNDLEIVFNDLEFCFNDIKLIWSIFKKDKTSDKIAGEAWLRRSNKSAVNLK
jgi:hypothetical protein